VAKIVAYSRGHDREQVQLVQACNLAQVSLLHEHKHHLQDVGAVNIIVVLHLSGVSLVDFTQELHVFFVAELWLLVEAHHAHDPNRNGAQTLLAPNLIGKLPDIESRFIKAFQICFVLFERLIDHVDRGRCRHLTTRVLRLVLRVQVQPQVPGFRHVHRGVLSEPAHPNLRLLGSGKIELLDDIYVKDVLLPDLFDCVVDLQDQRLLREAHLDCFQQIHNLGSRRLKIQCFLLFFGQHLLHSLKV